MNINLKNDQDFPAIQKKKSRVEGENNSRHVFWGDGGLALLSSRPPIIASFDSEVTDDDDEVDKKFEEYYQYRWS